MNKKLIRIDNVWYAIIYMFESEELALQHVEHDNDLVVEDSEDSGCWMLCAKMGVMENRVLNRIIKD